MGGLLPILVMGLAIGALPVWGHSRTWGFYPAGGLVLVLTLVLALMLLGRL